MIRWLYSITNSMDMNLSKFQEIGKDREAWHAAVHGVAKNRTGLSDRTHTHTHTHIYSCVWCLLKIKSIGSFSRKIHNKHKNLHPF